MNRTRILIVDDEPDTEEREAGHGRVIGIDANAMEALEAYRWTGNVRELRRLRARTRWPSSATAAFQPSSVVIASRSAAAAAVSPCTM